MSSPGIQPAGAPAQKVDAVIFATGLLDWSRNAGEYAALVARHFAARLVVAHAFVPSQAAMEAEAKGTPASEQRKDLTSRLAQAVAALSSGSLQISSALLPGVPEKVIPRLAEEYAPSLIALGTHGGSRLGRLVIGSAAEKILRTTCWPCLTIGPRVPPPDARELRFQRILYATDLTPAAAHAAAFAVFFAETLGAKIDVLHVMHEDGEGRATGSDRELRQRFYDALDGLVPRYAREFCDARAFVELGGTHRRILEHIEEHGIDLLVLGIKKSPHLDLEMRTSGAFQLLATAPCPVLTITG